MSDKKRNNFFFGQFSKVKFHLYRVLGLKCIKQKFSWGELYVRFDWLGNSIYFGNFENDEAELLQGLIRSDSTIIDVGANVGYYSVMLAKSASAGWVFSFEPSSREQELLCKNVALNNLKNVRVFKKGVGSKHGEEKLFINNANHGANSFIAPLINGTFEEVEVTTIDDAILAASPGRVDLIKIDVEGWEYEVLEGSKKVIEKFRPFIFFESWKSFKKTFHSKVSEEIDFLMRMNYYLATYRNDRLHKLKPGDEILTKDLLAVPAENKTLV